MSSLTKSLAAFAAILGLALPAQAAQNVAVSCSVTVDYTRNNNLAERYVKDFVVTEDAPFADDFGNRFRFKEFSASVTNNNGTSVVAINYYNDVGVFHAVDFSASLTMRGGGGDVHTASGSNGFSTSNLVQPGSVSGNHVTSYTLSCQRV